MSDKPVILCVDDERNVVDTMQVNLRKHFQVLTALSGPEGLSLIEQRPEIAVVISDMRMPEMDGAAFLAEVKKRAPTVVRMLLTGYSDIDAAMRAVNEGQIFRFLTKPCATEHVLATLEAGVEQHRLVTAEKELLQKTLLGSVKALVDVLALSNPMVLGRASRIRDTVRAVTKLLHLEQPWRVEFAALLAPLCAVWLPEEALRKLYDGEELEPGERLRLAENMATMKRILGHIPRLGPVILLLDELADLAGANQNAVPLAQVSESARVIWAAMELDALEARGQPWTETTQTLRARVDIYGQDLVEALLQWKDDPGQMQVMTIELSELQDGMVLCEDLKTVDDMLILPRGFSLNESFREHVMSFSDRLADRQIKVLMPSKRSGNDSADMTARAN